MSETVSKVLRDRIATEASHRCGYCLTDQRVSGAQMHVEHIIPKARDGKSEHSNLWLSCAWCNSYKGIQVEAEDPMTGTTVKLFNPRIQDWFVHFAWDRIREILGRKAKVIFCGKIRFAEVVDS